MEYRSRWRLRRRVFHVLAPTSEGDKTYPLLIERREPGIGGELGVKHKGGRDPSLDLFPEGEKAQHLIIGLLALDVCGRINVQMGTWPSTLWVCFALDTQRRIPLHS